ncbi:50S ribosomal protein L22 [archaeon CG10_big_fil_rev_8_21_14_0_10_43_11]|nr:MAG: 50S ribosomal protein L22 [archaeon CG10_big_fil_rev_8_21_14_0_10_43_11]
MTKHYMNVKENTARASTSYAPISFKHSVEVCNYIRGKKVSLALSYLERVKDKKAAIPFKRYNKDMSHKRGMGPGRYPVKACDHVIKLISNAVKNAEDKGLNTQSLIITEAVANRSMSRSWLKRYGRGKLTSMWLVVEETEKVERAKETKKPAKKAEKKQETAEKKEPKKTAPKTTHEEKQ